MTLLLVQVAAFLVAIGVLIAVHEYGHFAVARRLGFKVLRFSIGFGKPLVRHVGRDGVEYVLAAIPLGGYVKLADEREGPVPDADLERAFNRRPVWARIAVLVAGAGANFLFAIAAFWALFMLGVPGLKPVVGEVREDSIAAAAGLVTDDEIVEVDGDAVGTREAAVLGMLGVVVDRGRLELVVNRDGAEVPLVLEVPESQRRSLTEPGAWSAGLGFDFTEPDLPTTVGRVVEGGAAAAAGLRTGDEILAVDGERVTDFRDLVALIRGRPGETVTLDVQRGDERLRLPVAVRGERDSTLPDNPLVGRIGISPGGQATFPPGHETVERYGPFGAVVPALNETWEKTALTVKFLGRMLTGDVSLKNVSGPISIANYAGLSALSGIGAFLSFLAIISISLGVLNLLPIPILDGGQVVYQLAEAVKGSPLSERAQMLGQQVGIVLLILLMSLAFYNDIARHFG
ncbi:MAG: RIP metalloprotease RseP [Steroidobacteraceae bacterium]|jgi:regulator of sigma E protease|nr:RIP metalloprotease RseP [Steroidobacteraceae bacterium]